MPIVDWREMSEANTTGPVRWVMVQLADGSEVRAHFAQDLSGEEQPPFQGWFKETKSGFVQIFPLRWRPDDT